MSQKGAASKLVLRVGVSTDREAYGLTPLRLAQIVRLESLTYSKPVGNADRAD
jgi:hypothetical protein